MSRAASLLLLCNCIIMAAYWVMSILCLYFYTHRKLTILDGNLHKGYTLDVTSLPNHSCITGKLLPVVYRFFVSTPRCLCSAQIHPQLWCTKALLSMQVGCYSLWQCGVFGARPYCWGSLFYKAVNTDYEHQSIWTQHLWKSSFSDSRCSSGTTKSGLKLLIFTLAKHTASFNKKKSLYCF